MGDCQDPSDQSTESLEVLRFFHQLIRQRDFMEVIIPGYTLIGEP